MENQPVVNQSYVDPTLQTKSKPSFIIILLSVLLLISCVIAGFFAYQTQKLVKEINNLKRNQEVPTATPTNKEKATIEPITTWQEYIDPTGEFSFKFPNSFQEGPSTMGLRTYNDDSHGFYFHIGFFDMNNPNVDKPYTSLDEYIKSENYLNNKQVILDDKTVVKVTTQNGAKIIFFSKDKKTICSLDLAADVNHPESSSKAQDLFDQIFSTFKFIDNTKEEACIKEKYTWLSKYNECESTVLTETFCKKEKGTFNECESACRHEDPNGICTTECIAVCKF